MATLEEKKERTYIVAKSILNSEKSQKEIVDIIQNTPNGKIQLMVLDAFNAVAESQGRYPGGVPTIGDGILDKLSRNVKKFGSKAYKLSDKQVSIIIRELVSYRKAK